MHIESMLLSAKTHLQGLFTNFPVCIALLSILLFAGSANIAHLFLAASLTVIVPLIVLALRVILESIIGPSFSPSYWLTATTFIITYLFQNAYALYNKDASANAPQSKVAARKSQAVMAMISITAAAGLFIFLRPQEPLAASLIGLGAGIGTAVGIYNFMISCGGLRIADVFGIAGRIDFKSTDGTICYPVK